MAESGVREIQLSGKQLVFLFMASVVLVVVIFLLGVSVGRGTRSSMTAVAAAELGTTPQEGPPPPSPAAAATAGSLDYNKSLTGTPAKSTDTVATVDPPKAATSAPAASAVTPPAPVKSQPPAPAPAATAKPQAPPPTPPPAKTTAATTTATGVFVQVSSFKSKDLADALVTKLKGKGYDAVMVDATKAPFLHMVRVGPYAQRSAADDAIAQLKKDGFPQSYVLR